MCACVCARACACMCLCPYVSMHVCVCICVCRVSVSTMAHVPLPTGPCHWPLLRHFKDSLGCSFQPGLILTLYFSSLLGVCVFDTIPEAAMSCCNHQKTSLFFWSLTKLLIVWLWKEEFSPDFRIVCFCLTVQKAHPGRELRS